MANQIVVISNGVATTTTLAIAKGTGNEHKSVIQLVRNYLSDLEVFGRVAFEMRPFATAGGIQAREIANLNERQATLIMSYMKNTEIIRTFKITLTKKFYEMAEQLAAPQNPTLQLAHAMLLAGKVIEEQKEQIAQKDVIIAATLPKAAALDQISLAAGSLCLMDAAKTLGVQPKKVLIPYLKANKWIYQRTGSNHPVAYQDKLQQMLLEHKVTTVSLADGSEKITEQVRITPKGLTKLARVFGEECNA